MNSGPEVDAFFIHSLFLSSFLFLNSVILSLHIGTSLTFTNIFRTLQATDEDAGQNGAISYTINDGNIGNIFRINSSRYVMYFPCSSCCNFHERTNNSSINSEV